MHLANLSFTALSATDAPKIHDVCWEVKAGQGWDDIFSYFPEKHLCNWFALRGDDVTIYSFEKTGVAPLLSAYEMLVSKLELDAIVLVDGGTDSLMTGDEPGLGTPGEDASSMVAVSKIPKVDKLLVCLGFGVDHFHGVSHYNVLESIARLSKRNAFLGSFSLLPEMHEAKAFVEAVQYSNSIMRVHPSVVGNSIVSALEGYFGDYHATRRTSGSELFINPLMYFYWGFDLMEVVNDLLYSNQIENTTSFMEIMTVIETFRESIKCRGWHDLPL